MSCQVHEKEKEKRNRQAPTIHNGELDILLDAELVYVVN